MGMSKIKTSGLAALIALASVGMAPSRAQAGAVLNINLKGSSISGNFGTTQSIPCGTGTSTLFTFLSWNAFQAQERDHGTLTNILDSGIFIQQNNNCTGETTVDFAFVDTGITLTVNGTKSATLSGTFPLTVSGGVLTVNLTIGGTGNVFTGRNLSRSNIGPVLFMMRATSSSADATTVSGTAALNGQNIPLVNLSEVGGSISNNNTGTLQVVGARTFQ
jgi:hypothetical protein